MSNKINGVTQGQLGTAINRTSEQNNRAETQAKSGGSGVSRDATTVSLTQNAVLLGKLDQALAQVPEIDSAKVESVKAAIAGGNYEIDADKIAAALLKLDDEFGVG